MANYKYLGYFNYVDAVLLANKSADEIISSYNSDEDYYFYESKSGDIESDSYLIAEKAGEYTDDLKYIVVCDVADMFTNLSVNEILNSEEIRFANEFIDIYERIEDDEDTKKDKHTYTKDDLAEILRGMADYVESTNDNSYFKEVVNLGLFDDAIGEVSVINKDEIGDIISVETTIDY